MSPGTAHTLLASLIVVAYVVVTVMGFDGTGLLYLLGGQAAGAAVQKATAGA